MTVAEEALVIDCLGEPMVGVIHRPEGEATRGVLVVVGGPQYRVGSHRQFLLLARHLAADGIPVMRFDYRGMGDSPGASRTFESVGEDLRHAIDRFVEACPGVREVVVWGLCDAASAALFYAADDPRVAGLVLLNPWVRTEQGRARAYLLHYYTERLFSRDLWKKLLSGRFDFRASLRSFADLISKALGGSGGVSPRKVTDGGGAAEGPAPGDPTPPEPGPLPERVLAGLKRFSGPILLVLSGDDLTAEEFRSVARSSRAWKRATRRRGVEWRELAEANHTFSRREWRDQVARWTSEWLKSW